MVGIMVRYHYGRIRVGINDRIVLILAQGDTLPVWVPKVG